MIRFASINDVDKMAKIHVDTWLSTYTGIIPSDYLEKLTYDRSKEMFINSINQHIVAEIDNNVVGFASFGKERTGNYIYKGEIQGIYILKEYQGIGIGTLLFKEVVKNLKLMGIGNLMLWALEDNSYINFYKKLGGKVVDYKYVNFGNKSLKEIAFAWSTFEDLKY